VIAVGQSKYAPCSLRGLFPVFGTLLVVKHYLAAIRKFSVEKRVWTSLPNERCSPSLPAGHYPRVSLKACYASLRFRWNTSIHRFALIALEVSLRLRTENKLRDEAQTYSYASLECPLRLAKKAQDSALFLVHHQRICGCHLIEIISI
jgi:hypothetical protein